MEINAISLLVLSCIQYIFKICFSAWVTTDQVKRVGKLFLFDDSKALPIFIPNFLCEY